MHCALRTRTVHMQRHWREEITMAKAKAKAGMHICMYEAHVITIEYSIQTRPSDHIPHVAACSNDTEIRHQAKHSAQINQQIKTIFKLSGIGRGSVLFCNSLENNHCSFFFIAWKGKLIKKKKAPASSTLITFLSNLHCLIIWSFLWFSQSPAYHIIWYGVGVGVDQWQWWRTTPSHWGPGSAGLGEHCTLMSVLCCMWGRQLQNHVQVWPCHVTC